MSGRRAPPRLIALTVGDATPERLDELERRVADAVRGGLEALLLREPALEDGPFAALAGRLRGRFPELWLALHDRPHLAPAVGAVAVHLGFRSLAPEHVRPWLDADVALGLSTHAGDSDAGAGGELDYAFHGPVHPVSKPVAQEPVGSGGLARFVEACGARFPAGVWALGGLRPEHCGEVLAAGARGVAVLSGILPSRDPAGRARAYLRALG